MKLPTIYCINLKESVDRRKRMENRLRNHNLYNNTVFIDAVSRSSPLVDYYHQFASPDHHNPDEKGWRTVMACFASHLKAIRTFLETEDNECLICEDDIMFKNDFVKEYFKIRENFPPDVPFVSLSYMNNGWDKCQWTGVEPNRYNLCKTDPNTIWGMQLYWISKDYAIKVLTKFDKPFMNDKYDHCSEIIIKDQIGCMSYPVLAIEEAIDSTIHTDHLYYHKHMFDQWGRENYSDGDKIKID